MTDAEGRAFQPVFLIDGPSSFALLDELVLWRQECLEMLKEYPVHPQWCDELAQVERAIDERQDTHDDL